MYPAIGEQTGVTSYGLMLVISLLSCWHYARRRAASSGIDPSYIDLAVPLIFIVSTLGAGILEFIIPQDVNVAGELFQANNRYRLFGLLLIAFPVLFIFTRLTNLSFRQMLDIFALPVVLWLAIVRVGCFLAGCCWGDLANKHAELAETGLSAQISTVPWFTGDWIVTALRFPAGSYAYEQHMALGLIAPSAVESLSVHPTQLYETAGLLALLAWLRHYSNSERKPGEIALVMLAGYSTLRFLIEYLRADSALVLGAHTSTQVICVLLLAAAYLGKRFLGQNG